MGIQLQRETSPLDVTKFYWTFKRSNMLQLTRSLAAFWKMVLVKALSLLVWGLIQDTLVRTPICVCAQSLRLVLCCLASCCLTPLQKANDRMMLFCLFSQRSTTCLLVRTGRWRLLRPKPLRVLSCFSQERTPNTEFTECQKNIFNFSRMFCSVELISHF